MRQFSYTVEDAVGIHARPASLLVRTACAFQSDIQIEKGDKKADCKKVMAVMAMGVRCGDTASFTITGPDEEEAAIALEEYCRENL